MWQVFFLEQAVRLSLSQDFTVLWSSSLLKLPWQQQQKIREEQMQQLFKASIHDVTVRMYFLPGSLTKSTLNSFWKQIDL